MRFRDLYLAGTILILAACGKNGDAGRDKSARDRPVEVGFVVAQTSDVPVLAELAGRTAAFQMSEVRPQVSGVIQQRLFREGAFVRAGQPLYRIDSSLYRAAANEAQANLASAQASAQAATIRADRYRPLDAIEAISRQEYTDALAQSRQAQASVAQNRAAVETARINLRFTTVPAPISGRIGRSLFTAGALVTASQADPLAVIQRLDPMLVDIQQSSGALLSLRRGLAAGGTAPSRANVRLKLEDGSDYGLAGTVEFAEAMVDPATGTVTLRAAFPNPAGLLLPGMFVRAMFVQQVDSSAFLIPQQAVTRDAKGAATLYVVGANDKAEARTIIADRSVGSNWVVTSGVRRGDRVITQGLANVRPGVALRAVGARTPQRIAPPKSDKAAGADRKAG